jgi:hypothetical protein
MQRTLWHTLHKLVHLVCPPRDHVSLLRQLLQRAQQLILHRVDLACTTQARGAHPWGMRAYPFPVSDEVRWGARDAHARAEELLRREGQSTREGVRRGATRRDSARCLDLVVVGRLDLRIGREVVQEIR